MTQMSLKSIKAMFAPGQVWIGTRTPGPSGAAESVTTRTITKVRTRDYICDNGDTKGRFYGSFPKKASDVIEARDGYLKFKIDNKYTVALERK